MLNRITAHLAGSMLVAATALATSSAGASPGATPRAVEAYFSQRSYTPARIARLVVAPHRRRLRIEILRVTADGPPTMRSDVMQGARVTGPLTVGPGARQIRLRLGRWPSGLYTARLRGADGSVGYAPFVLRPHRLGEHRVAVVLPTNTWQAYNFRDADGDGTGDTWYADSRRVTSVDLSRAFLDRGVPPHFRGYDLGFLKWLARTDKRTDFCRKTISTAFPAATASRGHTT